MALRLYIRKCFFFIIINEPKIICKFRSFVYITLLNSFSFLFFFVCILEPTRLVTQQLSIKSKTNSPINLLVPITTAVSVSHRQLPFPKLFPPRSMGRRIAYSSVCFGWFSTSSTTVPRLVQICSAFLRISIFAVRREAAGKGRI